jgi:hypothetical protein
MKNNKEGDIKISVPMRKKTDLVQRIDNHAPNENV